MPEHSHEGPRSQAPGSTFFPESDFLESELTEITQIADGQVGELEVLHGLDPDQVPDDAVKKRLGLLFWVSSGWVVLIIALALAAPLLEKAGMPDPTRHVSNCGQPSCSFLKPFTKGAVLGTDKLSRDVFSRIVWGARVSLIVGFASIFFGLLIGGAIGVVAGFFKGKVEAVTMAIMDIMLAFPPLLLALALVSFASTAEVGQEPRMSKLWAVIAAISLVAIPPIARLVRASTLVYGNREFVLAAHTLGATKGRVIMKEIVPNVIPPIVAFGIIGVAIAIAAEGALAFLGLSVPPPSPTWGTMINEASKSMEDAWYLVLIPCTVLFLTILSLNLAGDRLREYYDIKESLL